MGRMGSEGNVRDRPKAWVAGLAVAMALALGFNAWSFILDRLGRRDIVESASASERRQGEGDALRRALRSERSPGTTRTRVTPRPAVRQRSDAPTQGSKEVADASDTDVVPVEDTAEAVDRAVCGQLEASQKIVDRLDALLTDPSFDEQTRGEIRLRRDDFEDAHRFLREVADGSGVLCE